MRFYESGDWGLSLIWGIEASVFPRSLVIAFPNALITFVLATILESSARLPDKSDKGFDTTDNSLKLLAGYSGVMFFVLYFRSNIAYARWWEGGTLLQKTRGEWFNAYSSLMAFTSTDPKLEGKVEEFQHLLARLMSLLFCCGLQQVSPCKDRPFEVLDLDGIDPQSLRFLNEASDKVEVILQWIQRATVLHMQTGVLPVAPPVLSRAFQEVSRGIVNLQNARKIADFPFPFPYAQVSMVMLTLHWCFTPVACSMMFSDYIWHRTLASVVSFCVIFFVWCINFIALQLEAPFGDRSNDLPMTQMQIDWNKSLTVLLAKRAQRPPEFIFNRAQHSKLDTLMSDGTVPKTRTRYISLFSEDRGSCERKSRRSTFVTRNSTVDAVEAVSVGTPISLAASTLPERASKIPSRSTSKLSVPDNHKKISLPSDAASVENSEVVSQESQGSNSDHASTIADDNFRAVGVGHLQRSGDEPPLENSEAEAGSAPRSKPRETANQTQGRSGDLQEKLVENASDISRRSFEMQLTDVGLRMKELHSRLIDEEIRLLASLTRYCVKL